MKARLASCDKLILVVPCDIYAAKKKINFRVQKTRLYFTSDLYIPFFLMTFFKDLAEVWQTGLFVPYGD